MTDSEAQPAKAAASSKGEMPVPTLFTNNGMMVNFNSNINPNNSLTLRSFSQLQNLAPDFWRGLSIGSPNRNVFPTLPTNWSQIQNTINSNVNQHSLNNVLGTLNLKTGSQGYSALPNEWTQPQFTPTATPTAGRNPPTSAFDSIQMKRSMGANESNEAGYDANKVSRRNLENPRSQQMKLERPQPMFHRPTAGLKAAKPSKGLGTETKGTVRWNSWSHEEEVFLVISVLDRFFRRGSLASSGKSSNSTNVDCWAEIKSYYDRICAAWHKLPENRVKPSLIARSTSALSRHFKIMKVRATEGDADGTKRGNFRRFLKEWDTNYNLNGRLIPDDY